VLKISGSISTTIMALVAVLNLLQPAGVFSQQSDSERRRTPIVEVFDKTSNAVVNIACIQVVERPAGVDELFGQFFDWRFRVDPRQRKKQVTSVGSGFVVHSAGYVVTNAHVVMKTVDQRVIFADGTEYKATPVSVDIESDLAVLKIDSGDRVLPDLELGRSDDLMIGETVVAIGNPLGYHHTLTTGVVSALDRTLSFSSGIEYSGLIQTDASINPGNSGGPLLNILGELIGVNTAIRGDAQNIGFAIPADELRRTLPKMLSLERLKRVRVGMHVQGHRQVHVVEVSDGSPASMAGIRIGDRLLKIDNQTIEQDVDVYFELLAKNAGDQVRFRIERKGRAQTARVILKAIPIPDGAKLARQRFGLHIAPLEPEISRALELEGGLFVRKVDRASVADRAGIQPGMIIVTIAGDFPRDTDHVGLLLEDIKQGDVVVFNIWSVERHRGRLLISPYRVPLQAR